MKKLESFAFANPKLPRKSSEAEQRPDPTTVVSAPSAASSSSISTRLESATVAHPASRLSSKLAQTIDGTGDDSPHLIVEARAGTGKTTTLVEALRRLKGHPTEGFVPSPQQQAVFDAVELSRGKVSSCCFVAFNRSIADELKARVPQGVEAMTMHSMGLKALTRTYPELRKFDLKDGRNVVPNLIAQTMGRGIWELRKDKRGGVILRAVEQLVSLCKMNLTDLWGMDFDLRGWQHKQLSKLAAEYEVELGYFASEVFDLVPVVLDKCRTDFAKNGFNFDDMIWLPVVLDLPITRYDMLMVDEAQDLNRCQQALAKRAGKRLILCGDPKQAIYGFAGADAESMPRMQRELQTDGEINGNTFAPSRGCVTLPLTVTRRCGKAIVREANRLVADFQAHESNGDGSVRESRMDRMRNDGTCQQRPYHEDVREGDLVLCRVNSRLISQCLQFIKMGRRAYIQGKDVGKGLAALVERLEASSVVDLIGKLDQWHTSEVAKENAKANPSESVIESLMDKRSCLMALTEGLDSKDHPNSVIRKLDQLFSDQNPGNSIKLSSIHKAKGTEAKRVFLLSLPSKKNDMPPAYVMTWLLDNEQEFNLLYVAITRAIEELIYVS